MTSKQYEQELETALEDSQAEVDRLTNETKSQSLKLARNETELERLERELAKL